MPLPAPATILPGGALRLLNISIPPARFTSYNRNSVPLQRQVESASFHGSCELRTALRFRQSRDCQVGVERSLFSRETLVGTRLLKTSVKLGELA